MRTGRIIVVNYWLRQLRFQLSRFSLIMFYVDHIDRLGFVYACICDSYREYTKSLNWIFIRDDTIAKGQTSMLSWLCSFVRSSQFVFVDVNSWEHKKIVSRAVIMDKRCVLNNCQKPSNEVALFEFPFRNPGLLKDWLRNIPKSISLF